MQVDLHTHSTASDGALSPSELVRAAAEAGVDTLAITDHDTLAAYETAPTSPLRLIPGVEFSTRWRKIGIHVVGLNVAVKGDAMTEAVATQARARRQRAEQIAERLSGYGLKDALAGAESQAHGSPPGRPHFARHMVETGFVATEREAFKKFLGSGKPCDFKLCWSPLQRIVDWIRAAGGTAVLAHPAKYNLTRNKLQALIEDFRVHGGQAMEVVSGRQLPNTTRDLAQLCRNANLWASWGSDFHRPGQPWAALGRYSLPPADIAPVWDHW